MAPTTVRLLLDSTIITCRKDLNDERVHREGGSGIDSSVSRNGDRLNLGQRAEAAARQQCPLPGTALDMIL